MPGRSEIMENRPRIGTNNRMDDLLFVNSWFYSWTVLPAPVERTEGAFKRLVEGLESLKK